VWRKRTGADSKTGNWEWGPAWALDKKATKRKPSKEEWWKKGVNVQMKMERNDVGGAKKYQEQAVTGKDSLKRNKIETEARLEENTNNKVLEIAVGGWRDFSVTPDLADSSPGGVGIGRNVSLRLDWGGSVRPTLR